MPDGEPFTDDLGREYTYDEIRDLMTEPFTMQVVGDELDIVTKVVNVGIDAHLEACYIPEFGDRYEVKTTTVKGKVLSVKLDCHVSKKSMPVLLRRLFESDDEKAWQLGRDIVDALEHDDEDESDFSPEAFDGPEEKCGPEPEDYD